MSGDAGRNVSAVSMDAAELDRLLAAGQHLEDEGKLTEAECVYLEAVRRFPSSPRALINLGNALHKQGRLDEAEVTHRAAIEADAAFAPAYYNLAVVLVNKGALAEATQTFERAVELMPTMQAGWQQLGELSERRKDYASACEYLRRALTVIPDESSLRPQLGSLLIEAGRPREARAVLEEALSRDPGDLRASFLLGRLAVDGFDYASASPHFKRVVEADPSNPDHWRPYLLTLNVRDDLSADVIAEEHFRFGEAMSHLAEVLPSPSRYSGSRRIRVGYVSGDFKAHPAAWFISAVLENHDSDAFEVFCYSNVAVEDEVTERIRALPEHWRSIRGQSDDAVVQTIRADGIDLLVDLSGHTNDGRLGVFARRASAVQVTWLGYLNTTGLRTMDYRIVDTYTDPVGASERLHSEQLIRMPHSQWCWTPPYPNIPGTPAKNLDRPVTFGSFNSLGKISDTCLRLWASILLRVPESLLRVYGLPSPDYEYELVRRFEIAGVARDRIATVGWLPIQEYFRAFDDVDIALDTVPYNGATTALSTYWMGVPLVALAGERGMSRGTYSIAKSAGLDELIARTPRQYVEMNVRLAESSSARSDLAQRLRGNLATSPLMDVQRFTRDLEHNYRSILRMRYQS